MGKIIIGSDKDGMRLKNFIKEYLLSEMFDVEDVSETPAEDFVESTVAVARAVDASKGSLGIAFDAYGAGSFMVASKLKGMIAAVVSDERSAYMTREHNNSRIITLGSKIVGDELARSIVKEFLQADYAGGRHQIRVDMLNKMA